MYKVIRASAGCEIVIIITPDNAVLGDTGAKYYVHDDGIQESGKEAFKEISEKEVMNYFRGLAYGMGSAKDPEKPFQSLKDVEEWRKEAQKKDYAEHP